MRVPSPRSGSVWKMPPCAQSLAVIFIDRPPVPVRDISMPSPSISTVTALVSVRPRWSGVSRGEHRRAHAAGDVLGVRRAGEGVVEHREVGVADVELVVLAAHGERRAELAAGDRPLAVAPRRSSSPSRCSRAGSRRPCSRPTSQPGRVPRARRRSSARAAPWLPARPICAASSEVVVRASWYPPGSLVSPAAPRPPGPHWSPRWLGASKLGVSGGLCPIGTCRQLAASFADPTARTVSPHARCASIQARANRTSSRCGISRASPCPAGPTRSRPVSAANAAPMAGKSSSS